MPKFMKMLNNISRSQAIYRQKKVDRDDLQSSQFAYVLAICQRPGRSQEELAKEFCINKSTVTRNLNHLEERGYISRKPIPNDKRQFAIYPEEKMLEVFPLVKAASKRWMELLMEGISNRELEVFNSVLLRMEERARDIILAEEDEK